MKNENTTNQREAEAVSQGITKKRGSSLGKTVAICLLVIFLIAGALAACLYALFSHYYSMMDYTNVSDETVVEDDEMREYLEQLKNDTPQNAKIKEELRQSILSLRDGKESIDGIINILLLGVDNSGISGDKGTYGSSKNTDSMIVCTINPSKKTIVLTSLMRDSCVEVVRPNGEIIVAKLNKAHAFGGYSGMFETIDRNFAIEVDRFVSVDFSSFVDIVDIVGGVDLYVTEEEAVEMNNVLEGINELFGDDLKEDKLEDTSAGTKHLNGRQALSYARIRYVTGSDFGRTDRQRKLIIAAASKIKVLGAGQLNTLLTTLLGQVSTNLTQSECASLLANAPSYLGYDIVSLRIPANGTYEGISFNGSSMLKVDLAANYREWKKAVQ